MRYAYIQCPSPHGMALEYFYAHFEYEGRYSFILQSVFFIIQNLQPRRGWRPGALTKTIAARLRAHRKSKGLGILQVPTFRRGGRGPDDDGPKVVPKPTLQIQKKEGTYWITMNPLKDPFSLVTIAYHYLLIRNCPSCICWSPDDVFK